MLQIANFDETVILDVNKVHFDPGTCEFFYRYRGDTRLSELQMRTFVVKEVSSYYGKGNCYLDMTSYDVMSIKGNVYTTLTGSVYR